MKVLFTAVDAWGHVNPMVPLARAFVARGDEVMWGSGAASCERLARDGFAVAQCGLSEQEFAVGRGRILASLAELPPPERPKVGFGKIFGGLLPGPMLNDLLPVVQDWKPDLVISEPAELAAPIAAALVGARSITHSWGIALPEQRVSDASDLVAALWSEHGLEPRPLGGKFDELYIDVFPPSLPQGPTGHFGEVQRMRLDVFAGAPHEDLAWLDTSSDVPLVYVTFGTVFNDVAAVGQAVEAVRDLPVRVVVTTGPNNDPSVIGPQPENVYVARYVPQDQLLPHCAAVVSHGGSGTFLASLIAGLPQLCLPQGADQFLNGEACAKSGTGLALEPGEATIESIRAAVKRLLTEDAFRQAARQISTDIATMPSPADVAEILAR
ncbi:glycosyltransferase [Smaragdicoccus niigatensis]|uniref:glycosyltransferase n=1 Tax=Smaragdicoccus niigatensis TaxID=359359 RepID=UPI00039B1D68|nr:glycosyltransferase [Smaragdicoccus niigatensis]